MPTPRVVMACSIALLATASGVGLVVGEAAGASRGAISTRPSSTPDASAAGRPTASFAGPRIGADEECRACHEHIAREWGASQHRSAWTDAPFQRAFVVEPLAFCRDCHAPEGRELPSGEVRLTAEVVRDPGSALGVSCVTCHLDGDGETVRAAPARPHGTHDVAAPHPIRRDPALMGAAACADCHEFDFPGTSLRGARLAMQSTVSEHAASSASERPCQDCHMPWVDSATGRHRSHAIAGGHDGELLARALAVTATRHEDATLSVGIATTSSVGHAVPTGDLFRRLAIELRVAGDDASREGMSSDRRAVFATRYLGRTFGDAAGQTRITVRQERRDDRPRAGGTAEVRLGIPAEHATAPLELRVWLERVQHPRGDDPRDAVVAGRTLAWSGRIDPVAAPVAAPAAAPSPHPSVRAPDTADTPSR
jgi:hypothetical protein